MPEKDFHQETGRRIFEGSDEVVEPTPVMTSVLVLYKSGPVERERFTNVFDIRFTEGFVRVTGKDGVPVTSRAYVMGNPIAQQEDNAEFLRQNIKQIEIYPA